MRRRPGSAAQRPRRGLARRLLRWAVGALLLLVLLSVAQVVAFRWLDPPTSGVMLWRRYEAWSTGEVLAIDHRWRPYAEISPALAIAVVAAEDQRFPQHHGFDTEAIRAAWARRQAGGSLRGGSTISQQVAKNLFLWPERSWLRKGLEAWYTVLVEALWPKRRILEMHLNLAEWGEGVFGAEAGARHHFGVPAAMLDPRQAARMAAVLPNPRAWRADAPGPVTQRRARWIEAQVRQLGGPAYLGSIGAER